MRCIASGVFAILCVAFAVTSCRFLNPATPVFKVTYVGHSYDEVVSAVRDGKARSAIVDVNHQSAEFVDLLLDLKDGQRWSLTDPRQMAAALQVIDRYNASVAGDARVVVHRRESHSGPIPASAGPRPTSHPRPGR